MRKHDVIHKTGNIFLINISLIHHATRGGPSHARSWVTCTKNFTKLFLNALLYSMLHRDRRASAGLWLGESMPPCRLRRRKFDYEMVHSEVYLDKYVVSIAPFSPPPFRKLLFSACFRFLIFHPFSKGGGGQLTPFVLICGRPCVAMSPFAVLDSTRVSLSFLLVAAAVLPYHPLFVQ